MEKPGNSLLPEQVVKEEIIEAAAIPCLNCGELLKGRFCMNCGQKSATQRLSLPEILHDLWHSLTHTDLGLLKLVKDLSYRPGHVVKAYLGGKRKTYFNPWTFYVLATAIYVFAATSTDYLQALDTASAPIIQGPANQQLAQQLIADFQKNLKLINFLFIPVLAAISWGFYRKSDLNYAEHLVFQAFIYGQTALAFCVMVLPLYLLFPGTVYYLNLVYAGLAFVYFSVALRQVFDNSWLVTSVKSAGIYLLNFLFLLMAFGGYAAYILWLKQAF